VVHIKLGGHRQVGTVTQNPFIRGRTLPDAGTPQPTVASGFHVPAGGVTKGGGYLDKDLENEDERS